MPSGLIIALGPSKKPSGSLSPAAKLRATGGRPPTPFGGQESPAKERAEPQSPGTNQPPVEGGKASAEEALFSTGDQRCGTCENWERDSSACKKVDGTMNFNDGCAKYFMAMGGGMEGLGAEPPVGGGAEPPMALGA